MVIILVIILIILVILVIILAIFLVSVILDIGLIILTPVSRMFKTSNQQFLLLVIVVLAKSILRSHFFLSSTDIDCKRLTCIFTLNFHIEDEPRVYTFSDEAS